MSTPVFDAILKLARVVDVDLMWNLDLDPEAMLFQRGASDTGA